MEPVSAKLPYVGWLYKPVLARRCIQASRLARVAYEEVSLVCLSLHFNICLNHWEQAFKYAHKRKTFGKRLVDHPVIRWKLAQMARQIEVFDYALIFRLVFDGSFIKATHAWLEQITYQLMTMSHAEASEKLGGPTALLKAQCTQVGVRVFNGSCHW